MSIEPLYFRPHKKTVNILVCLYAISILTYYFMTEEKDHFLQYLLAVTLPLSFIILFIISTRQVIISEHTITLRRFGCTHTTSFYKIKQIKYKHSFLRGGRYMEIRYADQFGMPNAMKIFGDYDLEEIHTILENGRRVE